MIHGSNMTRGHRGMRKGLSLMEMLVAIVLLGLIGTIGYNYYKNYYDTSFAAKQARIYVIVDQATQIRNAWDLYNTKNGEDPTVFADFITDRILTEVPVAMPLISAAGWQVAGVGVVAGAGAYGVIDLDGVGTADNDYAIVMPMDGTASDADKVDYCNILNNTANTAWSLDPTVSDIAAQPDLAVGGYAQNNYFYCFDDGGADLADDLVIGFTYRVDPS
jgi:prepilin-type N-terminal cleavage/methylation domain-containing protein